MASMMRASIINKNKLNAFATQLIDYNVSVICQYN